jgi:hypothetical protein
VSLACSRPAGAQYLAEPAFRTPAMAELHATTPYAGFIPATANPAPVTLATGPTPVRDTRPRPLSPGSNGRGKQAR